MKNKTQASLFSLVPSFSWLSASICLLFVSTFASPGHAVGTPFLIKDITTVPAPANVGALFDAGGGVLYFSATNGTSGNELFKYDSTNGAVLIKDINPGPSSSNPGNFVRMGGIAYFTADDGSMGRELWKTDGTLGGTVFIADLNTVGNASSNPSQLTVLGTNLYFVADDGVNGAELWKTDGTVVSLVQNINITAGTGSNVQFLKAVGTKLFFWADNGIHGLQLWSYESTTSTMTMLTPTAGFYPGSPVYDLNGSKAVFAAIDGYDVITGHGYEPWVSDGTVAGTTRFDVTFGYNSGFHGSEFGVLGGFGYFMGGTMNTGSQNLYRTDGTSAGYFNAVRLPQKFVTVGTNMFFVGLEVSACTGNINVSSTELRSIWKTDGTTTQKVATPNTDCYWNSGSPPSNLTNVNGTLYFSSPDSSISTTTSFLWKTNGITTTRLATKGMAPQSLAEIGGTLYFSYGGELWRSDGTDANTIKISINTGGTTGTTVSGALNINGITYFVADDGVNGAELWKSDGTTAGTVLVKDIEPGVIGSSPANLTAYNGNLIFTAYDTTNNSALWISDGTDAGTTPLMTYLETAPQSFAIVNGTLYFNASSQYPIGDELWRSDGTVVGTALVKDINAGYASSSSPRNLTTVDGTLFFTADDGTNGVELWKSDGTAAGTVMVKDISAGGAASSPSWLTNFGGTLYFTADNGINDVELWKSDGTDAGTVMVADISAVGSSMPIWLKVIGGKLFFAADNGTNGYQLYVADGTTVSSTTTINSTATKNTFTSDTNPMFTELNGSAYFAADDGVNGVELWKSDGTADGTFLIKDIFSGASSSSVTNLTSSNGALYFTANDGVDGAELWQSDGTMAGTSIAADILTGSDSSNPVYLVKSGAYLHFFANDGMYGNEPIGLLLDTTAPVDGTLTASALSSTQILLSWTAATDSGSGLATTNTYKLVRATGAVAPACTDAAVYQGAATSYNDSGLSVGIQYSYRVCASDAIGNVSIGATSQATTNTVSTYGHILDANTIALWRLDEAAASANAIDETGNYTLQQFGNPNAISGRIDNGRLLDGSTRFFQKQGDANFGTAMNGDWTYEGWAYIEPANAAAAVLFIYNGLSFSLNAADTILAEVVITPDSGGNRKLGWYQWQATGTNTLGTSAATLQTGQYYHLAVSRTAQGGNLFTYRMYVNGVLDTTTTDVVGLSYPVTGSAHYIGLGNYTDIGGFGVGSAKFNGRLDDTRISKIARSDAEILASSQRAAPLVGDMIKPTAVLDVPATVNSGQSFTLTGSRSFDAGGTIVSYIWTALDSDTNLFSNIPVTTTAATFDVVVSMANAINIGTHRFQLQVVDSSGNISDPTVATIIVIDTIKPTAVLDVPATVNSGQSFTLTGSRSSDVGGTIVSYIWTALDSDTNLSSNIPVTTTAATFDVVVSMVNAINIGTHRFQLQVVDSSGNRSEPTVATIAVIDTIKPTAVLDVPATVNSGQSFTLTGSRSSDVGGTIVSYIWTALDSDTNLSSNIPVTTTASTFDVVVSLTNLSIGTHRFQLQVVDNSGNISDPTVATIAVVDTIAPDTTFSLPVTAPTLNVGVTLSASDATGVSGYLLTENAAPPIATDITAQTAPSSFTFKTWGRRTLYAYAKDAAGNISAPKSATVLIGPTDGVIVPAPDNVPIKVEPQLPDALKSLNFAMKVGPPPTLSELMAGDVAPLVNGIPVPDGKITLGDTIVTLRRVVGL